MATTQGPVGGVGVTAVTCIRDIVPSCVPLLFASHNSVVPISCREVGFEKASAPGRSPGLFPKTPSTDRTRRFNPRIVAIRVACLKCSRRGYWCYLGLRLVVGL